jgi:hypothetical protein
LEQVRLGRSNPEIGEIMGISVDGVKFHIHNMLSKLGLASREELAAWQPRPDKAGPSQDSKLAATLLARIRPSPGTIPRPPWVSRAPLASGITFGVAALALVVLLASFTRGGEGLKGLAKTTPSVDEHNSSPVAPGRVRTPYDGGHVSRTSSPGMPADRAEGDCRKTIPHIELERPDGTRTCVATPKGGTGPVAVLLADDASVELRALVDRQIAGDAGGLTIIRAAAFDEFKLAVEAGATAIVIDRKSVRRGDRAWLARKIDGGLAVIGLNISLWDFTGFMRPTSRDWALGTKQGWRNGPQPAHNYSAFIVGAGTCKRVTRGGYGLPNSDRALVGEIRRLMMCQVSTAGP